MSTVSTIAAFEDWQRSETPLVMVTVIATEGSTYSKAGHRILIAGNGDYHGLVSGGCLEGDLAEHAREVIASGDARTLRYDLRDDADEPWGMGIGCDGSIDVLLQRLDHASGYQPFATMAECALTGRPAVCSIVTASDEPDRPVGATVVDWREETFSWQVAPEALDIAAEQRDSLRGTRETRVTQHDGLTLLHAPVRPVPRLLVLGAGTDAVPLVRMAAELGWLVTLADHREAYIEQPAFAAATATRHVVAGTLDDIGNTDQFAAALIMTHHLESDQAWLRALANTDIGYVGLLGPRTRYHRLLDEVPEAAALAGRLHAPVGLPIGGDSPETIALSILAGLQAFLSENGPW